MKTYIYQKTIHAVPAMMVNGSIWPDGLPLPEVKDTYYNMHTQLVDKPHIIDIALRAIEEACGFAKVVPIRGGTDGAQLSFMGLPCPNLFAGGVNFHSRYEFVSVQVMEKAVKTIVNIAAGVAER